MAYEHDVWVNRTKEGIEIYSYLPYAAKQEAEKYLERGFEVIEEGYVVDVYFIKLNYTEVIKDGE